MVAVVLGVVEMRPVDPARRCWYVAVPLIVRRFAASAVRT